MVPSFHARIGGLIATGLLLILPLGFIRAQVWPDSTIQRWQDSILRSHHIDRIDISDSLSPREQYEFFQHYPNSPENYHRPKNVVLHYDTVLFQDIWVDPELSSFFVSPEDPSLTWIVPPFKINGMSYYGWILRHVLSGDQSLPSWIIPDSTLIRIAWCCYHTPDDTSFCWPVTDEIETIPGDPDHWHERFHRPPGTKVEYDTGTFEGFMPAGDKNPAAIMVSDNSNREWATTLQYGFDGVEPPLLINGKSYYRQIVYPPQNSNQADATIGIMNALKNKVVPCPGCPPNLIPGHTRVAIPIIEGYGCDEIRILGQDTGTFFLRPSMRQILDTSIRLVKWDSLLAHDQAHFEVNTAANNPDFGQYYGLVQDSNQGGYYGYSNHDATKYVDLNSDGREDAIVLLSNPGSGAFATALIFLQTAQGPKFSGWAGGAHFWDTLYGDTLDVVTAGWLRYGQESQCCPSADDHQRIVGDGDTIKYLPMEVQPNWGWPYWKVELFYRALNEAPILYRAYIRHETNRRYAYSFLSPSYQASHPYEVWLKGFAKTRSIKAVVDENSPDTAVRVSITRVDSIGHRLVTRHFAGVWHLKRKGEHEDRLSDWVFQGSKIRLNEVHQR